MSLTIIVTRDVSGRYRGFLASVMPEIAPGVYLSPKLSRAIRERIWGVLGDWWTADPGGSIVLAWRNRDAPGEVAIETLGIPATALRTLDGIRVVFRPPVDSEHDVSESAAD